MDTPHFIMVALNDKWYPMLIFSLPFSKFQHTFDDADFENSKCVRMRVMDMILNEPASQSQSPIVVAPSDESSQSTSGLDSLVPGRVISEF